jgi:hypothetical protein
VGNNRARPTRVLGLNPADSSRIPIIATFILQKINASLLQVCRAPRIAAFPARGERRDQGSARWSDDLRAGVDGARWRRRCGRWAPHDRIDAVPTISAFAIAFFVDVVCRSRWAPRNLRQPQAGIRLLVSQNLLPDNLEFGY